LHNCKRITIFVEQFKTHIMIYVTDFFDALQFAEYGASHGVDKDLVKVAKDLAILELEKLRVKIEAL